MKVRNIARIVFFISTGILFASCLTACAGSVVGDAENVLSVISLAVSTLASVFAFIPGAAGLSVPLNAVGATVATLQQLFAEYKTTATETVYQKIQQFVQLLQQNLQALVSPEGVSSTLVTKINGIVSAILTQVGVWLALITQLQSSPTATPEEAHAEAVAAPVTVTTVKPMSSKAFHAQLKAIVDAESGVAEEDLIFKQSSRF